jgi:hypothetical protein
VTVKSHAIAIISDAFVRMSKIPKAILKLDEIACRVSESLEDFDTMHQARCGNKLSHAQLKTLRVTMVQEREKIQAK